MSVGLSILDQLLSLATESSLIRSGTQVPGKSRGDPAVVDRFLSNHHSNFVAGPVLVLRTIPVKIHSEGQADEVTSLRGRLGKSPAEGLLGLRQALGIQLVHPAHVVIRQISVARVARESLSGYAYRLRQLLLAGMSMSQVGKGMSIGFLIFGKPSSIVVDQGLELPRLARSLVKDGDQLLEISLVVLFQIPGLAVMGDRVEALSGSPQVTGHKIMNFGLAIGISDQVHPDEFFPERDGSLAVPIPVGTTVKGIVPQLHGGRTLEFVQHLKGQTPHLLGASGS